MTRVTTPAFTMEALLRCAADVGGADARRRSPADGSAAAAALGRLVQDALDVR